LQQCLGFFPLCCPLVAFNSLNYHCCKQVKELAKVLVQFQNLRQLELRIDGACDRNMDYFWLLDIVTTSPHLQKLTMSVSHSIVFFLMVLEIYFKTKQLYTVICMEV